MEYEEMLKDMIEHQKGYDDAVYEEFETEYEDTKVLLALYDELGEVNHELKALWCYWKKTQKPINEKNLLEELADCWHFALSYYYHEHNEDFDIAARRLFRNHVMVRPERSIRKSLRNYEMCYERLIKTSSAFTVLENLLEISLWCGFTFEQIYEAYLKKNNINWKRLKTGY